MVNGETPFVDVSGVDRSDQGTVGLAVVVTVTEAALAEIGAEFAESVFDFLTVEVAEAEFLQPR